MTIVVGLSLYVNAVFFLHSPQILRHIAGSREEDDGNTQDRLHDFVLASSDWLWETDAEHRYTYSSNELRNFGQDPEFRLGKTRRDLASESDRAPQKWREHYAMLDRHEPFRDFVYTRKVGDGLEHIISVSGTPRFDRAGRFLGYRGTGRNITSEVLAERRLREAMAATERANASKSQFLANMSHELRTPLNAIIGFSEALSTKMLGPLEARQVEYLDLIHQSGVHLLHIINDILDLSRVEAGKVEFSEEPIDLCDVAQNCLALLKGQAAAAAVALSAELETNLPRLMADPTQLKQILLNLLSNAIKFTEPGGAVTLTIQHARDGGVEVEICDTGIGMTESEIKVALEPFGQVEGSLARRRDGTGLGLPLARQLVELHGGMLHIESRKDCGTTVTVAMPVRRTLAGKDVSTQRPGTPMPADNNAAEAAVVAE